ncbi:lysophospholipase [Rhodobacteraceae bacterium NNCM2]|nr:lysophospholipase [Coraliihabitans acroporae]
MAAWRGCASLLLTVWLAACAAGGPLPAPVETPVAESGLRASDGATVAASRWEAAEPVALLIALHGYGDYGESTFADAGTFWAGQGITTIAYDQRGFGRNTSRGYWPGAAGLVEDLKAVVPQVAGAEDCLPVFVLGHSMGGGVALAAAPEVEVDGLILAAPAIWGGDELNPFHRAAAWTVASVFPDTRFTGEGVVRIQASDNIEMLRGLGRDPLYLRPPSAREILGLVRVTDLAETASDRVDLPALLLLGDKDQILPADAVMRVFARTRGEKTTIRYEDGWHLLFRDLQAELVWQDVADWVKEQAARKECPAAG